MNLNLTDESGSYAWLCSHASRAQTKCIQRRTKDRFGVSEIFATPTSIHVSQRHDTSYAKSRTWLLCLFGTKELCTFALRMRGSRPVGRDVRHWHAEVGVVLMCGVGG